MSTNGGIRLQSRRARTALCILVVGVSTISAPVTSFASPPVRAPIALMPDLQMARFGDIRLEFVGAQRQLRFDTTVVNLGAGPLEAHGSRASASDPMGVAQRIFDDEGGFADLSTTATMFFAGDGHAHWHVKDFETYILRRAGEPVRISQKSGYCFYDNVNYRPFTGPPAPVYQPENTCGVEQPQVLSTLSGLSVGWGDLYASTLPDQFIDVTGLRPGVYRLVGVTDRAQEFTESAEGNNKTWVRLEIKQTRLTVWSWGPSA